MQTGWNLLKSGKYWRLTKYRPLIAFCWDVYYKITSLNMKRQDCRNSVFIVKDVQFKDNVLSYRNGLQINCTFLLKLLKSTVPCIVVMSMC